METAGIVVVLVIYILESIGIGQEGAFYFTFMKIASLMTIIGILTIILFIVVWFINRFNSKLLLFGILLLVLFFTLGYDYRVDNMTFQEYFDLLRGEIILFPTLPLSIGGLIYVIVGIIYKNFKICFGYVNKNQAENRGSGKNAKILSRVIVLAIIFTLHIIDLIAYYAVYPSKNHYVVSIHLYVMVILLAYGYYSIEKQNRDRRLLSIMQEIGGESPIILRLYIYTITLLVALSVFIYSKSIWTFLGVMYGCLFVLLLTTSQEFRKTIIGLLNKLSAIFIGSRKTNRDSSSQFGTYYPLDLAEKYSYSKGSKEWGVVTITKFPASSPDKIPSSILQEFDNKLGIRVLMSNVTKLQILVPAKQGEGMAEASSVLHKLQQKYSGLSGEVGCQVFTKNDYLMSQINPYYQLKVNTQVIAKKINIFQTLSVISEKIPKNCIADIILVFNSRQPQYKSRVIQFIKKWEHHVGIKKSNEVIELWKDLPYAMDIYYRILNGSRSGSWQNDILFDAIAMDILKEFTQGPVQKASWQKTWRDAIINIVNLHVNRGIYVTSSVIDLRLDIPFHKIEQARLFPRELFASVEIPMDETKRQEYLKTYLPIGQAYLNGVLSNAEGHLTYDQFAANLLMIGQPGTGKTSMINHILRQFALNQSNVGILIINVAKKHEYNQYNDYSYFSLGNQLKVPYFATESHNIRQVKEAIGRVGKNLSAIFGLPDYLEILVHNPLNNYYTNTSADTPVPSSFSELLEAIQGYVCSKENQFDERVQVNIMQIIKQTIKFLKSDSLFINASSYTKSVPEWLERFLSGEKVFIDLNGLDERIQNALFVHILQLLDVSTRDRNIMDKTWIRNLVVIDEAHVLLSKPMGIEQTDDRFRRQYRVGEMFIQMLREFRSRGLGFLISDQQATGLIEGLPNLIKTKIMFKSGFHCALACSGDEELARFIESQPDFHCVVMDSTGTYQRYQVKTYPPSLSESKLSSRRPSPIQMQGSIIESKTDLAGNDLTSNRMQTFVLGSRSSYDVGANRLPKFRRNCDEIVNWIKNIVETDPLTIDSAILAQHDILKALLKQFILTKDIKGFYNLNLLIQHNFIVREIANRLDIPIEHLKPVENVILIQFLYDRRNPDRVITELESEAMKLKYGRVMKRNFRLCSNNILTESEIDKYFRDIDDLFKFMTKIFKKWCSWYDSKIGTYREMGGLA